jgi:hypothetical protein
VIVIVGLVILVAAVIAGVTGVLANGGHAHEVTHFAVFGYHVTGFTGTFFLYGIVIGALGMLGLSMLLAGARRTSCRGRDARRGLAQSRRETAAVSARPRPRSDSLVTVSQQRHDRTSSATRRGQHAAEPPGPDPPCCRSKEEPSWPSLV